MIGSVQRIIRQRVSPQVEIATTKAR